MGENMNNESYGKYLFPFLTAVLLLAIYKLFDSIEYIFDSIVSALSILSPIAGAFVIAFLLYPICQKCEKSIRSAKNLYIAKRARGISVTSVYVGAVAALAAVFYILVPTVAKSIVGFAEEIPSIISEIVKRVNTSKVFRIEASGIYNYIEKFISSTPLANPKLYTSTLIGVSKWLVNFVLSVIMSVYILLDRESLMQSAKLAAKIFISDKKCRFIKKYIAKGAFFTYRYFYCSLIDATIIFVLSFVLLSVIGVQYAPVLALMLGIFNLVPYFGSICASIIAVIISGVTSGASIAVVVGICLLILQQLDGNVIHPHLVKESLSIKPFWVLAGVFVGGGLFGLWGIVLSVPVMALIKSVVYDMLQQVNKQKHM